MKVFNRTTGRLEIRAASPAGRGTRSWQNIMGSGSVNAPSANLGNLPGEYTPAESMVPMHAAVVARQEKMRMVPLRLMNAAGEVVESGPLVDLLASPNQFQDWCGYVSLIESYLALYDFAIIAMVGEGLRPDELIPLNPTWCRPILGVHKPTGMRIALGFEYTDPGSGVTTRWNRDELIIIQGANPYAPMLRGLEAVRAAHRSVQLALATTEANLALFSNGGTPDVVLESDQQWTPEQTEEFMEGWDRNYGGYNNRHKAAILYGGLKVKTVGLNPEEMQAFEALRFARQDVCMALRVMPAMMMVMEGETGLSQGSSTEEQLVGWWGQVGIQELARIGEAHERFLIKPFAWTAGTRRRDLTVAENWAVRQFDRQRAVPRNRSAFTLLFDLNVVPELVEHRRKRMTDLVALRKEGYLPNDLNEYLDLALPEHPTNQGILPFAVQPVEALQQQGVEDGGRGTGNGERAAGTSSERSAGRPDAARALDALSRLEALMGEDQPRTATDGRGQTGDVARRSQADAALRRQFDLLLGNFHKAAESRWSRFFVEQRNRVLERLDAQGRNERANATRELSEDLLSEIFPRDVEDMALSARLTPIWSQAVEAGSEFFVENDVPGALENPLSVEDPRMKAAVERRRVQGTKVNDTTEDDLRELLKVAVEEGDTVSQYADRIKEYYGKDSKARPMTAARTQVAGTVNDGRMASAREVGGLRKYWIHGDPEDPRASHISAEEQYAADPIPLDEKFVVNGEEMDAPGDASASISNTANCTCMVGFAPLEDAA